jgi:hypothetical protein
MTSWPHEQRLADAREIARQFGASQIAVFAAAGFVATSCC